MLCVIRVRRGSFMWYLSPRKKDFLLSLGVDLRLKTDDRRVLEKIIFPYLLAREDYRRILFVGCDWYTAGYVRTFRAREFWTLEMDPEKRRYGAARHVVDLTQNVRRHFGAQTLDVVICNGLFGAGLDTREDVARSFRGYLECLRPGGLFVHGWNDQAKRKPFEPAESEGLAGFRAFEFAPLGGSRYLTANPNRHTFDFYLK
jgi:hypothetical protein